MTHDRLVSVSSSDDRLRVVSCRWVMLICACAMAACGDDASDTGGSAGASGAGSGAAAVGGKGGGVAVAGHGGGVAGKAGSAANGGGHSGSAGAGSGGKVGGAAGNEGDAGPNECAASCDPGQHCELVMVTCIQPPCPPAQQMCVDDPAPRGGTCGTRGAHACPDGQYCDYVRGKCGSDDSGGKCEDVPQVCDAIAMPVCGCDGKTYGNACDAARTRVSVKSDGACP